MTNTEQKFDTRGGFPPAHCTQPKEEAKPEPVKETPKSEGGAADDEEPKQ